MVSVAVVAGTVPGGGGVGGLDLGHLCSARAAWAGLGDGGGAGGSGDRVWRGVGG